MQVESLDHIHIYAADPHASARFYEHHFEAKEVHRNTGEAGEVQLFMALGGLNFNNNMALLLVFLLAAIAQLTTVLSYRNLVGLLLRVGR